MFRTAVGPAWNLGCFGQLLEQADLVLLTFFWISEVYACTSFLSFGYEAKAAEIEMPTADSVGSNTSERFLSWTYSIVWTLKTAITSD